jgi:glycosyltransferase involved in cell wall biosynthesis
MNLNVPEVSVVMSVYNGESVVENAIKSILGQLNVDFELVVVDDGSTDSTPSILAEYASRDSRIVVLSQENQGLTKSLITGCNAARGEIIARQDADDISFPRRLASQVKWMKQHELGFCSCWVQRVGPLAEPIDVIEVNGSTAELTERLRVQENGVPCHGSMMFYKEIYQQSGGYRPEFYFAQDIDLWSRMIEITQYGCVPEVMYQLRWSPTSISGSRSDLQARFHEIGRRCRTRRVSQQSEVDLLAEASSLIAVCRGNGSSAATRRNQSQAAYILGSTMLQSGNIAGRRYLRQALWCRPLFLKALLRYIASYL